MKIKDIPSENRPRERLRREGANVLSDAELLAVILQKETREENIVQRLYLRINNKIYHIPKRYCSIFSSA